MPKPLSFGEPDFSLVASMEENNGVSDPEAPFHMLVMGDFSGSAGRDSNKSTRPLTELKPVWVDRDTIGEVFGRLMVEIEPVLFKENVPPVSIKFSDMDDFHPDALYRRLDIFKALRDARQSLDDPQILTVLVDHLQSPALADGASGLPRTATNLEKGDLLDQIIEESQPEEQSAGSVSPATEWDSFLHTIVNPHLVARTNPGQAEMIEAVDAATSELMRMILHHKDFQALEAAWMGLSFLVSQLETDSQLKIFLLDVSKAEIAADLLSADDLQRTGLYKQLVERAVGTAGGQAWAVVAGNYTFEKSPEDVELLSRMAKITQAAGAAFVAAAGDKFLCENTLAKTPDPDDWHPLNDQESEKSWQALRQLPEATHLGLGLPRFLLRLPYGAKTDPVDLVPFEEMPAAPVHGDYLWGNPCFAIMLLLGQSFSLQGWQMQPGSAQEINSLPLHVYQQDGESFLKPCAEILMSQRAAENIMDKGFMPLLSFVNQDKVRLGRFQSIADPPTLLEGPWS